MPELPLPIESGDKMSNRERQLLAEIRFLEPLVSCGETSTDAIPDDLSNAYPDGGKWVGQIAAKFLRERLIVEIKTIRSARPARHKGKIGLFATADLAAVVARISLLRLQLQALLNDVEESAAGIKKESPATQKTLPGFNPID